VRRALPLIGLLVLAGCGGSKQVDPADAVRAAAGNAFPAGVSVRTRDVGSGSWVAWATAGAKAYAAVVRDGEVVHGGGVTLRPLGPAPGGRGAPIPQVAVEVEAPRAILDTSLLLDGAPLDTKGGGLTPQKISIYGAPAGALAAGRHVVVAYARAGEAAAATAWTFTVR
jgi:hypothetical protein